MIKNLEKNGLSLEPNGNKWWYKDDLLHRENSPAVELVNGYKEWWVNGKLHRVDGPAIEWADGDKSWYMNNEKIDCKDNEEFLRIVKLKAFL